MLGDGLVEWSEQFIIHSLAEVVIGELSDKEGMARKGDEGRKKVLDKFTFKQSCQRFESIYRDVMGARLIDQS